MGVLETGQTGVPSRAELLYTGKILSFSVLFQHEKFRRQFAEEARIATSSHMQETDAD